MTATAFLRCPYCCLSIVVNWVIMGCFQGSLSQSSRISSCFLFTNFYFMWLLLQVSLFLAFIGYDKLLCHVSLFPKQIFLWWHACRSVISDLPAKARQSFPLQVLFQEGFSATFFLPFHVVLLFHSRLPHLPTFPAPQIFVRQSWCIPTQRVSLQAGAGKIRNSR